MSPGPGEPRFALVLCPDQGRLACRLVRQAASRVASERADTVTCEPGEPIPPGAVPIFLDGSRECRAARQSGNSASGPVPAVYLPEVIAAHGLACWPNDLAAWAQEATAALARAVSNELERLRASQRERRDYFNSVAPVLDRYHNLKPALAQAGPPPSLAARDSDLARPVELARKRFRNLFARLDEILPPADLSTAHDLFQDALLCLSYAAAAWLEGDPRKWSDFLEKAESQVKPLLKAARNQA
jgi:hypothetical protein